MNDEALRDLARRAGISVEWKDHAGRLQIVASDVLLRILDALGLPSSTRGDMVASRRQVASKIQLHHAPAAHHGDGRAANAARSRSQ